MSLLTRAGRLQYAAEQYTRNYDERVGPQCYYEEDQHALPTVYLYKYVRRVGRFAVVCNHCLCDNDEVELRNFKFDNPDPFFLLCLPCFRAYCFFKWE